MLSVVFLVRIFFLSPLDAFLEVGLWWVSFTLTFLSEVRFGPSHLVARLLGSSLFSSERFRCAVRITS